MRPGACGGAWGLGRQAGRVVTGWPAGSVQQQPAGGVAAAASAVFSDVRAMEERTGGVATSHRIYFFGATTVLPFSAVRRRLVVGWLAMAGWCSGLEC